MLPEFTCGDGQTVWNGSLVKHFKFRERMGLECRFEGYDILNHPNFSNPASNVSVATGGVISSVDGFYSFHYNHAFVVVPADGVEVIGIVDA